ncbi:hypothetical protein Hanom_Chr03g00218751 [Helianthus anomalus]
MKTLRMYEAREFWGGPWRHCWSNCNLFPLSRLPVAVHPMSINIKYNYFSPVTHINRQLWRKLAETYPKSLLKNTQRFTGALSLYGNVIGFLQHLLKQIISVQPHNQHIY